MGAIISVKNLDKTYSGGFCALKNINLEIKKGEIFALLGPNGAGKTTLINIICGLVNPTAGSILVGGYDIIKDYRKSRSLIGLVPQELTTDAFETVWNTVSFSRGLFGKNKNNDFITSTLKNLSLIDKKDNQLRTLSGGMKRRVMIAKALSHEPEILFLDEPTAGVDVELRKSMWQQVHKLRQAGVTIILTTHYIEEAEEMADRIGVINKGQLIVTEDKDKLMKQLGKKQLTLDLHEPLQQIPSNLSGYDIQLKANGQQMVLSYDPQTSNGTITDLFEKLNSNNIKYNDLNTKQSSLEEIFVQLVNCP